MTYEQSETLAKLENYRTLDVHFNMPDVVFGGPIYITDGTGGIYVIDNDGSIIPLILLRNKE